MIYRQRSINFDHVTYPQLTIQNEMWKAVDIFAGIQTVKNIFRQKFLLKHHMFKEALCTQKQATWAFYTVHQIFNPAVLKESDRYGMGLCDRAYLLHTAAEGVKAALWAVEAMPPQPCWACSKCCCSIKGSTLAQSGLMAEEKGRTSLAPTEEQPGSWTVEAGDAKAQAGRHTGTCRHPKEIVVTTKGALRLWRHSDFNCRSHSRK